MASFSDDVVIACSPETLFAFVADLRNEPQWHTDLVSVAETTPAIPVVGETYAVEFKPFMGKTDGAFTPVEVVPGSRIVHRADMGGMRAMITYITEPADGGARLTRQLELKPAGMMRLAAPMMRLMVPKANRQFLANLKRVLEA